MVDQDTSNLNSYITQVEKDLVDEIVKKLKSNNISPAKAQSFAKEFLSQLPPKDFNALVDILKEISEKYEEMNHVYAKYYAIRGDMEDTKKVHAMASHIKQGNIEEAIAIAKGGDTNA